MHDHMGDGLTAGISGRPHTRQSHVMRGSRRSVVARACWQRERRGGRTLLKFRAGPPMERLPFGVQRGSHAVIGEEQMKIGVIGAGMIGSTVGKLWIDAGHEVRFASRHPEELQSLVARLGERASAGTPVDAAKYGEVIMLTTPLVAFPDLAPDLAPLVAGKIVLDTGNAYEKRDGAAGVAAVRHPQGSSGWTAAMFPGARLVKAFSSVYFKTLETEAHRAGDQVGIPLASDDPGAIEVAAQLVRDAGFDPVPFESLARGKEFEPGTKPYNTGMSGPELRAILGTE